MTKLRACYQNTSTDEGRWLATVAVYSEKLMSLDDESVRRAFEVADDKFPDWFPNRAQLVNLARSFERGASAKEARQITDGAVHDEEGAERAREIIRALTESKNMN